MTELRDPDLPRELRSILADTGLHARCLTIELTESAAMSDPEGTIAILHELRTLGVWLALDDFGTGYSSLSHLRQVPLDVLEIPKPFVDGLRFGVNDPILARAILGLAQALGLACVGEGIEEEYQARALAELGCELGQGHLFAQPLPAAEVAKYLRSHEAAFALLRRAVPA